MEPKTFLINALIDDDIDTFCHEYDEQGDTSRLRDMLFEGFSGYKNQTIEELVQELAERGLIGKGE